MFHCDCFKIIFKIIFKIFLLLLFSYLFCIPNFLIAATNAENDMFVNFYNWSVFVNV